MKQNENELNVYGSVRQQFFSSLFPDSFVFFIIKLMNRSNERNKNEIKQVNECF